MDISDKSKHAIQLFLREWWQSLSMQVRNTRPGIELPGCTKEELYNQDFGYVLRNIAAASEGLLPDEKKDEVYGAVQMVLEFMFSRPGMPYHYDIPAEWWSTRVGHHCKRALLWVSGSELITLAQASEFTGRSISSLEELLSNGLLAGYGDPSSDQIVYLDKNEVESL